MEPLLVESNDGLVVATLNRPEKRNALNPELWEALAEAHERFEADPSARVMVLTGAPPVFCAGMDLAAFSEGRRLGGTPGRSYFFNADHTKPVIAAVNGAALAGGFELVLACDLVVAADTAVFAVTEVLRGLFPAGGGAFRLLRQAGARMGMDLLLTGRSIDAATALAHGLVNQVVPAAELMPAAGKMAATIIAASPLGVAASLKIGRRALDLPEPELWRINTEEFAKIAASADAMEGSRAFVEKRPARWTGS